MAEQADKENGADPYVGTTLAERYAVRRRIGSGGMGNVYEAEHTLIGRRVALKMLHRKFIEDKTLLGRFMNEARAMGSLGHPNIAESYDIAVAPNGAPFLVMEYLEGHTLSRDIRAHGPMALDRALHLLGQTGAALACAHERGIVHRDVKPANIFVLPGDRVKVLDFGISKFDESDFVQTNVDSIMGSPNYMAPEQLSDPSSVDLRADVYALGAVLYEMLCGSPPFKGIPFPRILSVVRDAEPEPLEDLVPSLNVRVGEVIKRAMSKDREQRHGSVAELIGELQTCVSSVGAVNYYGTLNRPDSEGTALADPASHVGTTTVWQEWRAPMFIGTLLALLLAAAVVGVLALTDDAGGPAESGEPRPKSAPTASGANQDDSAELPPARGSNSNDADSDANTGARASDPTDRDSEPVPKASGRRSKQTKAPRSARAKTKRTASPKAPSTKRPSKSPQPHDDNEPVKRTEPKKPSRLPTIEKVPF